MVGGSISGIGGDGGADRLFGGFDVVGVALGLEDLLFPIPNGNGPRTALTGRLGSIISEEPEYIRMGLGGREPCFGGISLDAMRGVNECDRTWVCEFES